MQTPSPEIVISELGTMQAKGYGLTGFCLSRGCGHYGPIDLGALIARFGVDFDTVAGSDRLTAALKCTICGCREMEVHLNAPSGFDGGGGHRWAGHGA
jgi:hypothetical protein